MPALHTLYACSIAGTTIDEIVDFGVNPGTQLLMEALGGDVDFRFVSVGEQKPSITFSTCAITRALTACGINGLALGSVANFYAQKMAQDGTREGATSHLLMAVNAGLLVPRKLTAKQGEHARISYEMICRYNGTNNPIVMTANQSLGLSPAADQFFTVGKATINGTDLEGVTELSIDFNIEVEQHFSGGDVWPTFLTIKERKPMITIETADVVSLSTFGLIGTAQGATDSLCYLRKRAAGGGNVANATTEHISFAIDDGIINVESLSQNNRIMGSTIKIQPVYDGTNAVIAVSTATAIA